MNEDYILVKKKEEFIRTDNNTLLNKKSIIWVKIMNECLEVCVKANGCNKNPVFQKDTHTICKNTSPKSYLSLLNLEN